jgi:hypothetical protein
MIFNYIMSRGKSEIPVLPYSHRTPIVLPRTPLYSHCTPSYSLVLPKMLGVDEVSLFPPCYQMYVAKDFVDKSWISQPWFFFDVYTPEDAVFHGLSSGVIRVLGGPHFFIQNVEILEKTTNVFIERLSSSTLFSHRFIYMSTRKICELREQEMLFLLV